MGVEEVRGEGERRDGVPCSSACSGGIRSANSMSSRALNTSDAEMLLCCLEVETSCALRKRKHVMGGFSVV
jgi:hypothetical protein